MTPQSDLSAQSELLTATIPEEYTGHRVDLTLAALFPAYSRSRIQQWIRDGDARIDGRRLRPRDKVLAGQRVELVAHLEPAVDLEPQRIPLNIVFEDPHLIVLDKPAGLVVHPGAGNRDGTLVNALLHHDPSLETLPRAGLVHRIDKDTTGLLVVARTLAAHKSMVDQLAARTLRRGYQAVVSGLVTAGGTVDAPIARHRVHRTRMAVTGGGKPALTRYRVVRRYRAHTLLDLELDTGRTHQIRVHMAHIGYPLVGDPVYGGRPRPPAGADETLRQVLGGFGRQALHAARLGLRHPDSGEALAFDAPLPEDMEALLDALARDQERP